MSEKQYFAYKVIKISYEMFLSALTEGQVFAFKVVGGLKEPLEIVKIELEPWNRMVIVHIKAKSDVLVVEGEHIEPQEVVIRCERQEVVGPAYLGVVKVAP